MNAKPRPTTPPSGHSPAVGLPLLQDEAAMRGERGGYPGPVACKAAGITYRQLDHWARMQLVEPSLTGTGARPLYSPRNVVTLAVIRRLLDTGVSLQQVAKSVRHLNERTISDLFNLTLMSDGASVYECTSADEALDLVQGGQGIFVIAVGEVLHETASRLADEQAEASCHAAKPDRHEDPDEIASRRISRLIEESSLGTVGARRLRERTIPAAVAAVREQLQHLSSRQAEMRQQPSDPSTHGSQTAAGSEPVTASIIGLSIAHFGSKSMDIQSELARDLLIGLSDVYTQVGLRIPPEHQYWTGDGVMSLATQDIDLAVLASDFVQKLANWLIIRNQACDPDRRMQLRMSLHCGLVNVTTNGWQGRAVVETARLLEHEVGPALLTLREDATLLLMISQQVFKDAVERRRRGLSPENFYPLSGFGHKETRTPAGWACLYARDPIPVTSIMQINQIRARAAIMGPTIMGPIKE